MFELLVFFFKLFFSAFFSILFCYFIIENEDNSLEVMLFSTLGTLLSLIPMHSKLLVDSTYASILIFAILYFSYTFFDISNDNKKILYFFPGIAGVMIGFGLIIETAFLFGFLYFAKNNIYYIYNSKISEENGTEVEKKDI